MAKFTAKAKGNFLSLAAAVQKSKVELCPQERGNYWCEHAHFSVITSLDKALYSAISLLKFNRYKIQEVSGSNDYST